MSVITISREFGSNGDYIARRVAKELTFHLVDKKFMGDILGEYGYVEFDREYNSLPSFWERFNAQRGAQRDVIVQMLNKVIETVAQHGKVVILGRSGFEVLGKYDNVLHVRLQAPLAVRIGRVMEEHGLSFDDAEQLVKEQDRVRVAFVEEYYKVPWGDIRVFDMVINTAKVPSEFVVKWIVETARNRVMSPETYNLTTNDIVVDRVLAAAVSERLEQVANPVS